MTLLLVASLLLVPACQQQDPLTQTDNNATASTWRPGMTYTSTLEALVDDRPQLAQPQGARGAYNSTTNTETHDALPFTLESDTYESTRQNADGNPIETHTHIVPKVEFSTANNRKHVLNSVLALYDKTAKKTILATAVWSAFNPSGSDNKIKLHLDKVTLPAGTTLDEDHTWYMMGFFGGATIEGEKIAFKMPTQLTKVNPGKKDYEMVVPFATGWRKVQVQGTTIRPTAIAGRDKDASNITFRPQALFFDLQIENYMSMAMGLSSTITMESNRVTTQGEYDFSALKTDNSKFTGDEPNVDPKTYWQPTGKKKDYVNATWTKYNGQHYVSELKFNLADRPASIRARSGSTPGSVDGHYIIAVMPFTQDPLPQTLFFGEPKIVGRAIMHPTNVVASYTYDPSTLTPAFGNKFLLGSTGETLEARNSYAMRLRIIRPMLPIERIYVHNSDNPGFLATREQAESMPTDHMSAAIKGKYRLPRWSEIGPLLTINYTTLTTGEKVNTSTLTGGKVVDWGEEYRRVSHIVAAPQSVRLADTGHTLFDMRNIYNWSDGNRAGNQRRIYGLAYVNTNFYRGNYTQKTGGYVQPAKDGGSWNHTNMYKCAVRIILSQDNQRVRIATYYLGENLDINNQFYYTMHDSFWTSIAGPSGAVIERELPFNSANENILWCWGYKEGAILGEKTAGRIPILRSGQTYTGATDEYNSTKDKAWTLYWLKDRSW